MRVFTVTATAVAVLAAVCCVGAGTAVFYPWFSRNTGLRVSYWTLGARVCMPAGNDCRDIRWPDMVDFQLYELDAAVQADIEARGVCGDNLDLIEACMIARRVTDYGLDPSVPSYGIVHTIEPVAAMYATLVNVIIAAAITAIFVGITLAAADSTRVFLRWGFAVAACVAAIAVTVVVSLPVFVWRNDAGSYEPGFWIGLFVFGFCALMAILGALIVLYLFVPANNTTSSSSSSSSWRSIATSA